MDQAAAGAAGVQAVPALQQDGPAQAHRHGRRPQHRAHPPGPGRWLGWVGGVGMGGRSGPEGVEMLRSGVWAVAARGCGRGALSTQLSDSERAEA